MKVYEYPSHAEWKAITARPHIDPTRLHATVQTILDDVRENGDKAVIKYEEQFDHVKLNTLQVSEDEFKEAEATVSPELKNALQLAHDNIARFHEAQRFVGKPIETAPGVTCWQKSVPIERVGLYIPGGTAPLFSTVLMLAIPAKIAGCRDIVLCTPPSKNGKVHPAVLVASHIAGVNKVFKAGGVQAIGSLAFGTESIPKVYKIFGPGNQYVMAAKQLVSIHDTAIDMPAGPSEVCVIADDYCHVGYVAADLLSQAEHGIDSQVLLITTSAKVLADVQNEIDKQLQVLPRRELAAQTLANSKLVLVHDKDEAIALSNMYAPEHLIIATADYEQMAERVINAGSVFLGNYACESAGDYASGTNHTLPTHGNAVAYSGVNLDSFNRKITFQHLSEQGIKSIGRAVEVMADNEQLFAHKNAMTLRINTIKGKI